MHVLATILLQVITNCILFPGVRVFHDSLLGRVTKRKHDFEHPLSLSLSLPRSKMTGKEGAAKSPKNAHSGDWLVTCRTVPKAHLPPKKKSPEKAQEPIVEPRAGAWISSPSRWPRRAAPTRNSALLFAAWLLPLVLFLGFVCFVVLRFFAFKSPSTHLLCICATGAERGIGTTTSSSRVCPCHNAATEPPLVRCERGLITGCIESI
ncbi:hypothetical protein V8C26DRAFT_393967 [Trichoderma gracile]